MKLREHLKLYTWAVLLTSFLIASYTYYVASTSGYEVLVRTNDYGEHWIEVALIIAAIPGLWPLTKDALFTPQGPTQTN